MALADSVLQYGKTMRGLKSKGYTSKSISMFGDFAMDAGKGFAALGKATVPFRARAKEFERGSKILELGEEPTMLERMGLRNIEKRGGTFKSELLGREYTAGDIISVGVLGADTPEAMGARLEYGKVMGADWRTRFGKPYTEHLDDPDAQWRDKSEAFGYKAETPNIEALQEDDLPDLLKQEKKSWFQRVVERGKITQPKADYAPTKEEFAKWEAEKQAQEDVLVEEFKEEDKPFISDEDIPKPEFMKKQEKKLEIESDYNPKNTEHNKQLIVNAFKLFANTDVKDFKQISQLPSGTVSHAFRNLSVSQIWDKAFAGDYGKSWSQLTDADKAKIYSGL